MLGHSRQNVDRELIGVWIIDRRELDARFHQRGNERQIAGQPVELGDNQPRPMSPGSWH